MGARNFTIDKVRMVAALIVMMGHLLHIKGNTPGFLIGSHVEKVLSSGSFAVVVFFGLSGVALRYQIERFGINLRWLIARFIRLMPVYWVTLLPPIVGCYLIGVKIDYPGYGFVIASLGLQAISSHLYLPPVNGPLWSLSVELYLSASLLLVGKVKRKTNLYILAALVIFNVFLPGNVILQGLPIFYFCYLLAGYRSQLRNGKTFKILVISIPIFILLIEPGLVQTRFDGALNFLLRSTLASLIVIWVLASVDSNASVISDISQRSYSLYAVHAPIVLFIDKIFFVNEATTSGLQILLSIVSIVVATEFLYQFIEKPSIKFSRKYLNKQAL